MRDTNLSDDMLKLVRYKILFVKRDYEVAFPEREDLIWENISDTALAAWKVAEFIQSLDTTEVPRKWLDKNYPKERQKKTEQGRDVWYIQGLPEDDKKYLRVFFEVLDRYPREKLRYEERQLDVLEEIARAVKGKHKGYSNSDGESEGNGKVTPGPSSGPAPGPATNDAFDVLLKRVDEHKGLFAQWRAGFTRCSQQLAQSIKTTFAEFQDVGDFPTIKLDGDALEKAFRQGVAGDLPFNEEILNAFSGRSKGHLREYKIATRALGLDPPDAFNVWDEVVRTGGVYVQKTTASIERYVPTNNLPDLSQRKIDLLLNVFREDVGLVSWGSNYQPGRLEMPFICYVPSQDVVLWINQMWTENLRPMMENVFLVSVKWEGDYKGSPAFLMVSMMFHVNFEQCKAQRIGDGFFKGKFEIDGPKEEVPVYDELVKRLLSQEKTLKQWRHQFKTCCKKLSASIAKTFNKHRRVGEFEAVEIDAVQLEQAFAQGVQKNFDISDFDRFVGRWTAIFRGYDLQSEKEVFGIPHHTVWGKTTQPQDIHVQRVAGSAADHFDPHRLTDLSSGIVDIVIDLYRDDIGITSWMSRHQQQRAEVPLIGYKLNDEHFLWISQDWTEELKPVKENEFGIALEWRGRGKDEGHYFLVAFTFQIDFKNCTASSSAPVAKGFYSKAGAHGG